jgi:hypothetical protein
MGTLGGKGSRTNNESKRAFETWEGEGLGKCGVWEGREGVTLCRILYGPFPNVPLCGFFFLSHCLSWISSRFCSWDHVSRQACTYDHSDACICLARRTHRGVGPY